LPVSSCADTHERDLSGQIALGIGVYGKSSGGFTVHLHEEGIHRAARIDIDRCSGPSLSGITGSFGFDIERENGNGAIGEFRCFGKASIYEDFNALPRGGINDVLPPLRSWWTDRLLEVRIFGISVETVPSNP
jgi:hypothetical protein